MLPTREYAYYAAIDPGFTGAIGVINRAGTSCRVYDMPNTPGEGKKREMDLPGLKAIFAEIKRFPSVFLGIEWPHTKPGDFGDVAGNAERFGRGKGILESFAYLMGFTYTKVDPLAWKKKLGVPGKTDPKAIETCAALWDAQYRAATGLIRGPRGGVKDGRLDALLIAHYLRTANKPISDTVRRYGKDSPEAACAILGWGGRGKRLTLRQN